MDEVKFSVWESMKLGFGFGLGVVLLTAVPAIGILLYCCWSSVSDIIFP